MKFILFLVTTIAVNGDILFIEEDNVPSGKMLVSKFNVNTYFNSDYTAKFSININRKSDLPRNTSNEYLLFHESVPIDIGIAIEEELVRCCTRPLYVADLCSEVNHLIWKLPKNTTGEYYHYSVNNNIVVQSVDLKSTGIWHMYLANCNEDVLFGNITGYIMWENTFGYLSSEYVTYLLLYMITSIIYCLYTVFWAKVIITQWKELNNYKILLTAIVTCALASNIIWAIHYIHLNVFGLTNLYLIMCASLFSSFYMSIIRVIVLFRSEEIFVTNHNHSRYYMYGVANALALFYAISVYTDKCNQVMLDSNYIIDKFQIIITSLMLVLSNISFLIAKIVIMGKQQRQQLMNTWKQSVKAKNILLFVIFIITFSVFWIELAIKIDNYTNYEFRVYLECYWQVIYFSIIYYLCFNIDHKIKNKSESIKINKKENKKDGEKDDKNDEIEDHAPSNPEYDLPLKKLSNHINHIK